MTATLWPETLAWGQSMVMSLQDLSVNVAQLSLLLAIAAMLHVIEEFVFPGRFIQWYNLFMPAKTKGRDPSFLVFINTLMMFLLLFAMHLGNTNGGASLWVGIAIFLVINGLFHLYGVIKLYRYSPGVVTGLLLYIPLAIVGMKALYHQRLVSMTYIGTFFLIAIVYHILSARAQGR
ncbi:HXXEE domain-containing protein [Celerinatantimonas yamalensis]|uniref:HXXEE domain-containing protein n=1 Tax=Celerinatantimonas yamalensis TaxID=559956 RepID=A0ABW9G516_9GAMM